MGAEGKYGVTKEDLHKTNSSTVEWCFYRAASSYISIPSCTTPINFSYYKNTIFNIPDYIIQKSFSRFRISFRIM